MMILCLLEGLEASLKAEEMGLHQREKKRDEQKRLWKEFCGRKEEILKWVKKTDAVIEDLDEPKDSVQQLGASANAIKVSSVLFIIFRPYFIWERKIFKSNGFFFLQNLPRNIVYVI